MTLCSPLQNQAELHINLLLYYLALSSQVICSLMQADFTTSNEKTRFFTSAVHVSLHVPLLIVLSLCLFTFRRL